MTTEFTYHSKDTAPAESQALIDASMAAYGFFPKLHQVMAEAPATYRAYLETFRIFAEETTLSPLEQQVVMQTANFENRCHYCTAGHSMLMQMSKMPDDVIEALREGTPISDTKLEALRTFARELIESRGHIGDERLQVFLDAGFDKRQALEVLTGLATKLLSNFTNALAHTELDDPVKPLAWTHPADRAA
ncbi:carboxymuconolactone decarboxylase family protein [Pseudovibrio exalbescens]|uniref:carboxymuconolactone decarboxylase family protein n=1 Tax=Pseudovibrio exalbescens TaxID=197461 RepID=UPI00236729D5|nr:carboxymuconolactone decarboxylase family protein [Pseudovibrio exalbescens]MDD7908333.1 carboxymuconolactone decarboxylase family protein [Pseudovibrio exalbescens]